MTDRPRPCYPFDTVIATAVEQLRQIGEALRRHPDEAILTYSWEYLMTTVKELEGVRMQVEISTDDLPERGVDPDDD